MSKVTEIKKNRFEEIMKKAEHCGGILWLTEEEKKEGAKLSLEIQTEELSNMTDEELYTLHDTPSYTCKIDKEKKSWTSGIIIYRGKKYNIRSGEMEQNGEFVYDDYIYWHVGNDYFTSTKQHFSGTDGIGQISTWEIAEINRDGVKCELWVSKYPSVNSLSNGIRFAARKEIEKRE